MDDAARCLSRYFLTQLAINAAFGIIIGTGLFFIGIPSPVSVGRARRIPAVRALCRRAPGWHHSRCARRSRRSWLAKAVAAAALFLVAEPIMGQVVEPMFMAVAPASHRYPSSYRPSSGPALGPDRTHPRDTFDPVPGRARTRTSNGSNFSTSFWATGRPSTPVENFYQRILSGDPVEALEQAELLLKERSLSSYYDEITRKGLQLASSDVLRGVITEAQMERMQDAVYELIEGLDGHPDADPDAAATENDVVTAPGAEKRLPRQPAPDVPLPLEDARPPAWRSPTAVMCVGGRRALDEGLAAMLAQLLQKHGLGAYTIAREELSRTQIASFDGRGALIVCISYLDIVGIPFQLRYMVRRILSRLPNAVIVPAFGGPMTRRSATSSSESQVAPITMCARCARPSPAVL